MDVPGSEFGSTPGSAPGVAGSSIPPAVLPAFVTYDQDSPAAGVSIFGSTLGSATVPPPDI